MVHNHTGKDYLDSHSLETRKTRGLCSDILLEDKVFTCPTSRASFTPESSNTYLII